MTKAWVVVGEDGSYSDYSMWLESVHDSEEAAQHAVAQLEEKWRMREEERQKSLAERLAVLNPLIGRPADAPVDHWLLDSILMHGPQKAREAADAYLRSRNVDYGDERDGEFSVHGPFDVVPWSKP